MKKTYFCPKAELETLKVGEDILLLSVESGDLFKMSLGEDAGWQ